MQHYTAYLHCLITMIIVVGNSGTFEEAIGTFKQVTDSLLNLNLKIGTMQLCKSLEAN